MRKNFRFWKLLIPPLIQYHFLEISYKSKQILIDQPFITTILQNSISSTLYLLVQKLSYSESPAHQHYSLRTKHQYPCIRNKGRAPQALFISPIETNQYTSSKHILKAFFSPSRNRQTGSRRRAPVEIEFHRWLTRYSQTPSPPPNDRGELLQF